MIRRARALNADRPGCRFLLNRAPNLRLFASHSFDLVYSRLVLQHIPPQAVRQYVLEMLRVLALGGVLMFQLPERIDDAEDHFLNAPVTGNAIKRALPLCVVRSYRRAKYRLIARRQRGMRMFGVERDEVVRLVTTARGRFLAIDDDHGHGTRQNGYAYWVTHQRQFTGPTTT